MQKEQLISRFQELYGMEGGVIRTFFAPGIVNLIGDHTDYNGGRAFPFALNMGIATLAGSMPLFFVVPLVILIGLGLHEQGKLDKGTIFTILVVLVIIIDILVMIYLADQGRLNGIF